MYRYLLSILYIASITMSAHAGDAVSTWLQHMGCDQLLASYYEELLENGSQKERVDAATELANLYAVLLSRDSSSNDEATLERAAALLQRMPEAGTVDLRIQLLRAGYLTSEQMLEKYRLRFVTKDLADVSIAQLRDIASSFNRLRETFLRKTRTSKGKNQENTRRLGLVTSLLAWSKYYIAWHEDDQQTAREASLLFASMLQGEEATLQHVSLDFKEFDYGARALLGIALCKDVMNDPAGAEPWLEELEDYTTWPAVRMQIPMWRFFLDIDHKKWKKVLAQMHSVEDMDKILILRLAIVHALEDAKTSTAQQVATTAIESLVKLGQLGIVSEIVDSYGFAALPPRGFITKYIQGDLEYRKLREEHPNEEPSIDPVVIQKYLKIASIFNEALLASDMQQFQQLSDDCSYMLGLSLFHAGSFNEAATAFTAASNGDSAERAIWMAIVSLDHVSETTSVATRKEILASRYISSWPNNTRATKLLLHQSQVETVSKDRLDDLLAVPHNDPQYDDAQEQACRLLYKSWQTATSHDRSSIGNQYVFIAVPLMLTEHGLGAEDVDTNHLAVRAFRILEVSLHPEVARIVAAKNAFTILDELQQSGQYQLETQLSEYTYRKILLSNLTGDGVSLMSDMDLMITHYPNDAWTVAAAKVIWNSWKQSGEVIEDEVKFTLGMQILHPLSDEDIATPQYFEIAHAVAEAGSNVNESHPNPATATESLRIARLLVAAYPQNAKVLKLNSLVETRSGDKVVALQHWRDLASRSKRGSLDWLEARFQIISSLAKQKPTDALALLDQHHVLYPSYGADPFGTQLRQLHLQLQGDADES